MGYHTINYYMRNIIRGNVEKTGHTWWFDAKLENPALPSHYQGFIPVDVAIERLFGWTAEESVELKARFRIGRAPAVELDDDGNPVLDEFGEQIQLVEAIPVVVDGKHIADDAGNLLYDYWVPVEDHKAIGRGDWIVNGIPEDEESGARKILSVNDIDYGTHQLKDVFIDNVAGLVGGEDQIGLESVGLLKWGRRAFGSLSIPENLLNEVSGMEFRPILTVCTSFDKTLATKYIRTFGIPVCDNTLNWEIAKAGEKDGQFVIRHTKNSAVRLKDARQVLGLLTEQADAMNVWLGEQAKEGEVTEEAFQAWLNIMVPIPEIKTTTMTVKSIQGEDVQVQKISANAQTIAVKKRDKLVEMYDRDPRVSPWKGTRLGILQLWNTFQQHESSFKGAKKFDGNVNAARAEMNVNKMIDGVFQREDENALRALTQALVEHPAPVLVAAGAPAPKTTSRRKSADNN